jgi:hypothetical protein
MSRLDPGKLHVRFAAGVAAEGPLTPRRYTLTHSDSTGDLFLTIAPEVDQKRISGWYTRLMRDEVVAEWQEGEEGAALHVFCHVSGGLVFGSAGMRYGIFQREMPRRRVRSPISRMFGEYKSNWRNAERPSVSGPFSVCTSERSSVATV